MPGSEARAQAGAAPRRTSTSSKRAGEKVQLPQLFIGRPVMTTLVMVAIFTFGIIAYQKLPVSDLPTVDYPTISV